MMLPEAARRRHLAVQLKLAIVKQGQGCPDGRRSLDHADVDVAWQS